jgi:hypothetical protein
MSFRQTIALTVAGTAVLTAGAIIGGQALRRQVRTGKLKESVSKELDLSPEPWNPTFAEERNPTSYADSMQTEWETGSFDEELIREQVGAGSTIVMQTKCSFYLGGCGFSSRVTTAFSARSR